MSEGFICKDCNYTNDAPGTCPHCDMPLDPIEVDEVTGEVQEYDLDTINDVEAATSDDPEYKPDPNRGSKSLIEDDEFDKIIDLGEEGEESKTDQEKIKITNDKRKGEDNKD